MRSSLENPTVNIDYRGATGFIVCITGGSDINLFNAEDIATPISSTHDPHTDVVWE